MWHPEREERFDAADLEILIPILGGVPLETNNTSRRRGKRLRPHTNEVPKCMVRLGNIPLIERQLASIASCDFDKDDIALVGGYKQDKLNRLGIRQFKNPRYALTNMVTTLFCARDFMKSDEDLIISYGDIVYEKSAAILDTP